MLTEKAHLAQKKLAVRVGELRRASVLTAETVCQFALGAALEALAALTRLEASLDAKTTRATISTYISATLDGDELPSLAVVLPKVEYYRGRPQDLLQDVRDLNDVLKPALVLDEAAEILEAAFWRASDRAHGAIVEVGTATADSPFTVADVARYAQYCDGRLKDLLGKREGEEAL